MEWIKTEAKLHAKAKFVLDKYHMHKYIITIFSHIYADRMSARPLGWSNTGADNIAGLRVYKKNGGEMLELVRYQKREQPKASGAEEIAYSAGKVIRSERRIDGLVI